MARCGWLRLVQRVVLMNWDYREAYVYAVRVQTQLHMGDLIFELLSNGIFTIARRVSPVCAGSSTPLNSGVNGDTAQEKSPKASHLFHLSIHLSIRPSQVQIANMRDIFEIRYGIRGGPFAREVQADKGFESSGPAGVLSESNKDRGSGILANVAEAIISISALRRTCRR